MNVKKQKPMNEEYKKEAVAPKETTASEIGTNAPIEQSENTKNTDIFQQINEQVDVLEKEKYYVTGAELLARKVERIPCLLEPILQQTGVGCIAGASDTGKSSWLRQLCIAIVSKQDTFLNFKLNAKHHSAIYISTEDDEEAISSLLYEQNKYYKFSDEELSGLRIVFYTENLLKKLEEMLQEQPCDIVVIDTFTDLYGGEMNATNKVRSFINDFNQLAIKYKFLLMFLHHVGKRAEEMQEPSKHNLIGSQGFEAKMRVVLELRTDYTDKSKKHLCIVKGNYLPKEYKEQSYVLLFNENMVFENTNERTPFEQLVKDGKNKKQAHEEQIARVIEDAGKGYTLEQIAKNIGKGKSTLSEQITKACKDNGIEATTFAEKCFELGKVFGNEQNRTNTEQTQTSMPF